MAKMLTRSLVTFQMFLMAFGASTNILRDVQPLGVLTPAPPSCYLAETGTFVRFEVTSCSTGTSVSPCELVYPFWYEFAIAFTPATSTNSLLFGIKFIPYSGDSEILDEVPIPGGFTAGRTYRVQHEINFPKHMIGKNGTMEVWIRDVKDTRADINRSIINRCFKVTIAPSSVNNNFNIEKH